MARQKLKINVNKCSDFSGNSASCCWLLWATVPNLSRKINYQTLQKI